MSRYLELLSVHRPIDIDRDENERQQFSINVEARAEAPVTDWERELRRRLIDAGAASTTDTFIGRAAVVPTGAGPYLNIVDTGGIAPEETHNGTKIERLSAQIVVRASGYEVARTRALAVWRAVDGWRHGTLTA